MSKLNAPVALIIMDGWGVGDAQSTTNAVNVGKTPVIDGLTAKYPHAQLACSGEAVGLPDGQMGNSEVGHTNIGAGRIVYQELTRITKAIREGAFFKNPVFLDVTLWNKQVELPLEQKIKLATQIIIGKLKNQLNLIKYYHKYHKDILGGKLSEKYVEVVLKIDKLIEKAKNYSQRNEKYTAELMAIESQAAIAYWSYIRVLTADDGIDFIRREHQGATDLLNSLLNYGYAILYARVWKNILAAKLNPSIGVLHAKQDGKPTLVFDVVELFRAQMVDRVVISLIQKKVSLKMHDGLLNESSKRVLIRYILERLNRYEKYRGEEITFSQIILRQAQEIALFISGDNLIFKPYVAKW